MSRTLSPPAVAPSGPVRPIRRWLIAGAVVVAAAAAVAGWYVLKGPSADGPRSPAAKAAATERKQKAAADLQYPAPSASLPPAITIAYDEAKDRTRMTLI